MQDNSAKGEYLLRGLGGESGEKRERSREELYGPPEVLVVLTTAASTCSGNSFSRLTGCRAHCTGLLTQNHPVSRVISKLPLSTIKQKMCIYS